MDQPKTAVTKDSEETNIPKYHTFKDKPTGEGFTLLKIRVDSDEGRAYEKLSTDAERLQYMRKHAHEESKHRMAQWTFYQDLKAGKIYNILDRSPEGEALAKLLPEDSDDEWPEGSKEEEAVLQYFKKHAHEVENIKEKAIKGSS